MPAHRSPQPRRAKRPRLYVNCIAEYDWLIALEYGRVDEGQPETAWRAIDEHFSFLYDGDDCVGFKLTGLREFDLESKSHEALWSGPRFDAPALALSNCTTAEVILAARVHFDGRSSINRLYFNAAIDAEGTSGELSDWLCCVESGDSMAHYGLGIALHDVGEFNRAYTHLRFYASIALREPWAQYWLARAALAIGEVAEAGAAARKSQALATDPHLQKAVGSLLDQLAKIR